MSKFDPDKFPTSEAAKRMLGRVSPVYAKAYTAKWIYQVLGLEWDETRNIVLSLREQAFTQTVTWGIEYQEHKYSLKPDDTLSLEERRERLYRRKTKKYPLNPWFVENYLQTAWNIYADLDETYDWGVLRLGIFYDDDNNLRKMLKDMRGIKQSHLVWKLFYDIIFAGEFAEEEAAKDNEFSVTIHTAEGGWHDYYSYGVNNPNIHAHGDGSKHSAFICRNGVWRHNGAIRRDGNTPGAIRRGGAEDLAHDRLEIRASLNYEDSYQVQGEHFGYGVGFDFADKVETTDGGGDAIFDVYNRHNGAFYHNGAHARGARKYADALGGGLSISRICRNGAWCHGDTRINRGQTVFVG